MIDKPFDIYQTGNTFGAISEIKNLFRFYTTITFKKFITFLSKR